MSEGYSTTSTSGSTYPPAAMETPRADLGATTANLNTAGGAENSTTGAAKEQAGEVAGTARDAGTQVAGTAKEQAGAVTAEATHQARQLLNQVQSEISDQASTQQRRVAGGLHSLADELQGLVNGQPKEGMAQDVARTASDKAHEIADWLDRRDPASMLDEVRSYARRRPGAFLAIALGAGIVAGRLTKSLTASKDGGQQSGISGGSTGRGFLPAGYPGAGQRGADYTGADYAGTGTAVSGAAGYVQGGRGAGSHGQDDAVLTAGDVPAVQAIPPVEGYGAPGAPRGDLNR